MSFPHRLTGLSEREAITDAVHRAVLAFDNNDASLLKSAFIVDGSFEMNGNVIEGVDKICSDLLARVGPLDTTHLVTNIRVDLKESSSTKTASVTATALAQHCPTGRGIESNGPKYLAGSTYVLDLIKDGNDGIWKIKTWKMKVVWAQGDASVMM